MSTLKEPVAKRIAKLFCRLGSDHEGEALAVVSAMKRLFKSEGLTFTDIGIVIENANGEIEERKYSDSDAEIIFARGVEKGRAEEAGKQQAPPVFYDSDGRPRWHEIAAFCQKESARLRIDKERTFIDDMVGNTLFRQPTDKQAKWLFAIFVKLGGYYEPKAS
jgi:hypothetical protein